MPGIGVERLILREPGAPGCRGPVPYALSSAAAAATLTSAMDTRRALFLLASGGFVSGLTMRVAEPLLPKVAHDFGVSVAAAAVLITGFTLAYGLFQLVHGPLGDRIGKLRAVTIALLLTAVACAACAAASSLQTLALCRFLTGMTAGAVIPLSFAFVGDNVAYEGRQALLGRFIAGNLLGQTFGPLLGGVFSDSIGWRATFLVPAAAFFVIGLLLIPLARAEGAAQLHRAGGVNPVRRYVSLLRLRRVRIVLVAVALEGFLFFGTFAYLGAYLRHDFDLSYTAIGFILAGFGLGGVLYSVLVRVLVLRLGQRGLVGAGGVLLLVCFVVLALAVSWAVCALAITTLGLAFYMLHNTLQTRATEMAPEARGSAVSAFAFCLFLGQTLGVSTVGLGIEHAGYRPLIGMTGAALAVLAFWFRRRLVQL
jgi:MFS transporter, YNFM family, putative membrane transport protein